MNLIKFFVIASLLSAFSVSIQAQNVKPKFKKVQFVVYNQQGLGDKQSINIETVIEIDKNGTLHYMVNWYRDGFTKDTTYSIPDTLAAKLNEVFNGDKKLETHRITDKMPGEYVGPKEFVTYTAYDNKTDNFIFVNGYVDKELGDLLENLRALPRPVLKHQGVYDNQTLAALILKYHLASKYIPKNSQEHPTLRQLEIASPPSSHK